MTTSNNEITQRSTEWYEQRLGKFTASEIHKLMGIKGIGKTGETYAKEKAIEQLFGQIEENYQSSSMLKGIEMEPLAFNKFKQLKSLEFINVYNCGAFVNDEHSGASPDGLVGEDAVLEIKCPESKAFFELVAENVFDQNFFYQTQMQMLCTNRKKAYLFFYLIHEGEEYWHEIIIPRCDKTIALILDRIREATKIKNDYISKIKKNKQWINDVETEIFEIENEDF